LRKTKIQPWSFLTTLAVLVGFLYPGHVSPQGPEILKVNGLYLGMPLHDAIEIAGTLTDVTDYTLRPFNLSEFKFRKFESKEHRYWYAGRSVVSPIVLAADARKQVTFISIHGPLVKQLFPYEEKSPEDFSRSFAAAHGLPAMNPFEQANQSPLPNLIPDAGWQFLSPFGYKITVYSNKDIDIEKTGLPD